MSSSGVGYVTAAAFYLAWSYPERCHNEAAYARLGGTARSRSLQARAKIVSAERVAFVLHDVFGYPFDDIRALLGRSGMAVRQLANRARRKLQGAHEPGRRAGRS